MEYSFSAIIHDPVANEKVDGFGLGFKRRGTWWAVENLNGDSGLFDAEVENAIKSLRLWFEQTGLPAWHPPRREGFYRFLVVRKSMASQRLLFNLVTSSEGLASFPTAAFVDAMTERFGDRLQGILHTINDDKGERVEARAGDSTCIFGEPFVTERLHGLDFDVEMASFFQTNPASAERLYEEALKEAIESLDGDSDDGKLIMDLFCGTGTIAQLLARASGRRIIGVDIVEQAIIDAKKSESTLLNRPSSTRKKVLQKMASQMLSFSPPMSENSFWNTPNTKGKFRPSYWILLGQASHPKPCAKSFDLVLSASFMFLVIPQRRRATS